MAETNGTTPPLFREALVQAGLWTMTDSWQRWLSAFWHQQQTLAQQSPGPGPWQPQDATLTAFAALAGTPDTFAYFAATESMALTGLSAYSRSLLALGDGGTWRSSLGLGTMSVQNASAVAITGGQLSYLTSVPPTPALHIANSAGPGVTGLLSEVMAAGGANRYALYCTGDAPIRLHGPLEVHAPMYLVVAPTFGDAAGTRTNLGLGAAATQPYTSGTFTATCTGMAATVTGTARYVQVGKQATVVLPMLAGTSNATTFSITGLPAALWPAIDTRIPASMTDGVTNFVGVLIVNAAGTMDLYHADYSGWPASGSKGLNTAALTYVLP